MRLGHVELFVKDTAASREFYEGVLGFEPVAIQHGGRVVWYRCGDREILLRSGSGAPVNRAYALAAVGLVLFTDDLPAEVERLKARGLVFRGEDGPGCPTFRDPDGHWWQIVNPSKA